MKLYLKKLTGIFAIAGLIFSLCLTEAHSRLSHIRERHNRRISSMLDRAAARAPRGHTRAMSLGRVSLAGGGAIRRPGTRPNLPSTSDVKSINDLKDTYQEALKAIQQDRQAELSPIEAEIAEAVEALEEEFGTQIDNLNKELDIMIDAKDKAVSELRKEFISDLLTAVKEGNLGDIGDLISDYRSNRKEVSKAFDGKISDIKDNIADAEEAQEKAVESVKESYSDDLKEINDRYDTKADDLLAEYKSDVKDYWKERFGNQDIPDSVLDPDKKTKLSDLRNIRRITSSGISRTSVSRNQVSATPARALNFRAASAPASRVRGSGSTSIPYMKFGGSGNSTSVPLMKFGGSGNSTSVPLMKFGGSGNSTSIKLMGFNNADWNN